MLNMTARILCVLLLVSMYNTTKLIASEMRWRGDCLVMQTSDSPFSSGDSRCVLYRNCKERCGYNGNGQSCSCDHLCWFHGDCCPDYHIVCLHLHSSAKTEELLDAILSTYNSLYQVQRFWDRLNWIKTSECHDTTNGPCLLVSKCSHRPEIISRFYDLQQRISSLKTKSHFLKYLSDKPIADIIKSCEEASSKTASEKFLLEKIHYFDAAVGAAFYNVFCALCNGVLATFYYLDVKCNIEEYDPFMSMSLLYNLTNNYQCSVFTDINLISSCDKRDYDTAASTVKMKRQFEEHCFKTWYIFDNIDRKISFKNPDCFHCFLDKVPEGHESIGHLDECMSLKCNCSDIDVPVYNVTNFISGFNVINVNDSLSTSVKSCEVHQIYQPWSNQCLDLLCDRNHKPFYGNCIQFYGWWGLNRSKEDCLGLRPIKKVRFGSISHLFKSPKIPKLQLQISYHYMGEMLKNLINVTENKDTSERKCILDFCFTLQELLSLRKSNVELIGNEQYFEHVMHIIFKSISDRLSEAMNYLPAKGKVVESLFCTKLNDKCVRHRNSIILKQPFFTDNYNPRNWSGSSQGYPEFPNQKQQIDHTLESPYGYFSFVFRAEQSGSIDPFIRTFLTVYQTMNTQTPDIISTMFMSKVTIVNRDLMRSGGQPPTQVKETYGELSINKTYDITCPKGRQLIFNQVDVNKKLFEQKKDIKMYLDTDEIPLDNPWFEMSFSYDTNEIAIDNVIVSLCIPSLNDNVSFCHHGSVLLFPYSSVYCYKQLLIISADINKVSDFFQNVELKYYPPVELIDNLERYIGQWGVKVYHKTSYILTNKGALVCTDSSNIYQDDREKIFNLLRMQSKSGTSLSPTVTCGLTWFLLYLSCL